MENLENLKILTKENIDRRKKLNLKTPSRYRNIEDYNTKYFLNTIPGLKKPLWETVINEEGKKEDVKFVAGLGHDKHILLAMAFSKAEKLFGELRKKFKVEKQEIFTLEEEKDAPEGQRDVPFSAIESLAMSSQLLSGKNSSLLKSLKQGDRKELNEFARNLEFVHKTLEELRNYHAHILHEPGPLKFQNLYQETVTGKPTQDKWDAAKNWIVSKMNDAKAHRIKTLKGRLVKLNQELEKTGLNRQQIKNIDKSIEDTQIVLDIINGYKFENADGFITNEALLFIACMFLRKGEAEYFVKKWTGLKKTQDMFRITQVFFTYYSIRDKKSLHEQNSDLLKFRKMIGILSTMPEFKNDCFMPFNKFIKGHNDSYGKQIDAAHYKNDKEKWSIPLRKNFNPTHWYLNYLVEKGYLNDFKIACYKSDVERLEYMQENDIDKDAGDLKQKMKNAAGDEKRKLTGIYKEGKKNFLFKAPSDANENFCIKNENAMIQYPSFGYKYNTSILIQVNLSSDFLMKWVFADIVLNKGESVKQRFISSIKKQYEDLVKGEFDKCYVKPPCIAKAVDNPQSGFSYSIDKGRELIFKKIENLNKFQKQNAAQRAPWKYEAKKKMDYIFEYVHLTYTFRALDTNKTIADRRHDAMSDNEYLDALQFIRFYGKNCNTPEFRKFFFEDKKEYFHSLEGCMAKSQTLEELYNVVFGQFCEFYEKICKKLTNGNLTKFIKVFKPHVVSDKSKIKYHAELFATNQVVLHELINIQELAKDNQYYKEWIEDRKNKNNNRKMPFNEEFNTDFSLMRFMLSKRNPFDTNTDFMMKIVMPELLRKNLLPKNEQGKLQGNTSMFNTLMKNKTDELMMWEIAKYYREKAYNSIQNKKVKTDIERIFQSEYSLPILVKDKNTMINTPYKTNLFFFKIYSQDLILPLGDKKNQIEIKIKPKKFDDEFQYYEIAELYHFIKSIEKESIDNNMPPKPPKGADGFWHYEQLNKEMKDTLAKYLDDVYLLLRVEKEIVQRNYDELTKIISKKYQTENWDGYQLIFGREKAENESIENILGKKVYDTIHPTDNGFSLKDLITYRNKILHQQIQPDKTKYVSIKRALFNFCLKNNMIK